jgi:hypothetical protein
MSNTTLCEAVKCEASHRCRRHSDCPAQYPAEMFHQWYGEFEPEKGEACVGFICHIWHGKNKGD